MMDSDCDGGRDKRTVYSPEIVVGVQLPAFRRRIMNIEHSVRPRI